MALESNEFYFFYGRYNPLSNWHPSGFFMKDIWFHNVECFMMYCKAKLFGDEVMAAKILACDDPAEVKKMGRQVKGYVDAEWARRRGPYVRQGLLAKVQQNRDVRDFLLSKAQGKYIVEAARNDTIWGVGLAESDPLILDRKNWRGQNLLGECWMWVLLQLIEQV